MILAIVFALQSCSPSVENKVKTTFQTSREWRPMIDNRADAVMVYGVGGNPSDTTDHPSVEYRLASWKNKGYQTHFMTGIAWGHYKDYFTGEWDGKAHIDEGQVNQEGDTLWHGPMVPYIVPTENYLKYFKETQIKRVIDAGVDYIFLEEPEFWAAGGYSESFKREWEAFYGSPWRPQHESPEATYMSSKLKYHLYYRALNEAFTYAKEYGKSLGRDIKCFVPTHSLINYTQWKIVSPEASLASLPCVDGYIAQVWTGTSRVLNYYKGVCKERVFETAFLEYGCMSSMTEPTGRRVWFLTDPIEDRPRDWNDFKRNYQATFTAQMLYPQIADYEVMPWPARIYEGLHPVSPGSSEKVRIQEDFASMMQVMINALQKMPLAERTTPGISVLMANSMMFQAFPSHSGYDDPQFSNFFGLAMPMLKRGTPVGITHIENLGYEKALEGVDVLLMSYSNMKPLDKEAHQHLADWVRCGGHIIYSATDEDPFQSVQEWWNTGEYSFKAPSDHLFALMGVEAASAEGVYSYGKGSLTILRKDPKDYVYAGECEKPLIDAIESIIGPMNISNALVLERGPYRIVAVMDEGETEDSYVAEGCLIDLYDSNLPVYSRKEVRPGNQALFFDVTKAGKAPEILASGSRAYNEKKTRRSFSYICKGPIETVNVARILLPAAPSEVLVNGTPVNAEWDEFSRTVLLRFPNNPDGVSVSIRW